MKMKSILLGLCMLLAWGASQAVMAGLAEVVNVEMVESESGWLVRVTVKHADTGWEHYADAWRLVDGDGKVVGHRTLHHPHVNEQPFTRSQNGIQIEKSTQTLYVEVHDSVHGWNPARVQINLQQDKGERYRIVRLPAK